MTTTAEASDFADVIIMAGGAGGLEHAILISPQYPSGFK
jgi:hypothetical protein